MRIQIKHRLHYAYSQPVFCEPLTLRLRPRDDPRQRLLLHELRIEPDPSGRSEYLDLEGNTGTQVWFNQLVESVTVSAVSIVETCDTNQFEFLLNREARTVPLVYDSELEAILQPYRSTAENSPEVSNLARVISIESDQETIQFLVGLNQRIYSTCRQIVRLCGDAWTPDFTLSQGEGACRDLAAVFLAACRSQGLAARLVSGYNALPDAQQQCHLHAWCEVYLPGGGWRGFDPTCGLTVSNRHVAVVGGLSPKLVSPAYGTFRGSDAISTLTADVTVEIQ